MLDITALSACHGRVRVLHELTFAVRPGEVVALLGANGAGKSTLLHTLSGLHRPERGTVTLAGRAITGLPAHELACRGLGLVPAGRELFAELTVVENLRMGLHRCGVPPGEAAARLAEVYDLFPVLAEFADRRAALLSGGQQQMLALGRALVRRPQVLLLDEPSLGLAPLMVRQILDTVAALAHRGAAVLLAEQNATAALRIADRGVVLENGHLTRHDRADVLLADPDVSRHYLGGATDPAVSTTTQPTTTQPATTRTLPAGLRSDLR
ncbi:MAG TPA: ABC transporter ATP-binding protein [Mycobacteriales bacterium]|jgi:branched-chain amino acid transport system ATP-binding protein|nr:ABC transporter ATP-binding protein [Mycobacteriales bacterium]